MSQPFAFLGQLQLPADASLPPDSIPVNGSGTFVPKLIATLIATGAGTTPIPFGSVITPGAKFLMIEVDGVTLAPVMVSLNGATPGLEIAPGGFLILSSPAPAAGVTSGGITTTGAATIRIWILG